MGLSSIASMINSSGFCPRSFSKLPFAPLLASTYSVQLFPAKSKAFILRKMPGNATDRAQALDLQGSFYESGLGSDDEPPLITGSGMTAIEEKEPPQCPPGLRQYETMAVLRPDMSEDERLALAQKYEELLVAGGGMSMEVFNRGVVLLAYSIKKKNKAGESNTYLDGIYLPFTYFTKTESLPILEETLNADDDVIGSSCFKIRKRKYWY